MEKTLFVALGSLGTLAALGTVLLRNPVHAAMALIVALLSTAGLYLLLSAPFLAVIQIAVYAGAIMVLFLFVIMLLNIDLKARAKSLTMMLGILLGGILAFEGLWLVRGVAFTVPGGLPAGFGSAAGIGEYLFNQYAIPFELVSILLLVAIIAAVLLGKKELT